MVFSRYRPVRTQAPRYSLTGLGVLAISSAIFLSPAAAAENVVWKTGPEFKRQLDAKTGLTWPESPLRDALMRLAQSQQVAIVLDRRVDPQRVVSIENRELAPLDEVFRQLAKRSDLGVAYVGPVAYFGPQPAAVRMATLLALKRQAAARLPSGVRLRLAQRRPCNWEILAEPRELVAETAGEYGLKLAGSELIPHDLWPAADLPSLTFIERMTLLLAGFDLSYEWSDDGSALRLVPIDDKAIVERVYKVPAASRTAANQLAARFPQAKFTPTTGGLRVAANFADHDAIHQLLVGRPAPSNSTNQGSTNQASRSNTRFTLPVENQPAGAVIQSIVRRQNLQLDVDPTAYQQLKSLVTFSVNEVTLDELLKKTLAPVNLSYRLEEDTLHIFRAVQE